MLPLVCTLGGDGCTLHRYTRRVVSTSRGDLLIYASACVYVVLSVYTLLTLDLFVYPPLILRKQLIVLVDQMCQGVLRVLKPGGLFLQMSFEQPHFRKKFLQVSKVDR